MVAAGHEELHINKLIGSWGDEWVLHWFLANALKLIYLFLDDIYLFTCCLSCLFFGIVLNTELGGSHILKTTSVALLLISHIGVSIFYQKRWEENITTQNQMSHPQLSLVWQQIIHHKLGALLDKSSMCLTVGVRDEVAVLDSNLQMSSSC